MFMRGFTFLIMAYLSGSRKRTEGVMSLNDLRKDLRKYGNKKRGELLKNFFKTGPGEYGEGDVFMGVRVPSARRVAKRYRDLPITEIGRLLRSSLHEERLVALLILIHRFSKGTPLEKEEIYNLYLSSTRHINNWDLVDISAPNIIGAFLWGKDSKVLYRLSGSVDLWERRISLLSTLYFIKRGDFSDTLKIAARLLRDNEDLIHKASGWMLREIGKRDMSLTEEFLREHYDEVPRTMLRYAIERFPENKRKDILKGKFGEVKW